MTGTAIENITHKITVLSGSAGGITGIAYLQDALPLIFTAASFLLALASFLVNYHFKKRDSLLKIKDEERKAAEEVRRKEIHEFTMQKLNYEVQDRRVCLRKDTNDRRREGD